MTDKMDVNGRTYDVAKLLGHGKGGYSYLVQADGKQYVLKQIHHEPCAYYQFGNKIEAELRDYERLRAAGIRVPEMIACDVQAERIVKEYIEGDVIFDLVARGASVEAYLPQARQMAEQARAAGLNIDYECNAYMDEWSFENWGARYWSMTPEFQKALAEKKAQEEA